jgi:Ca2+-binding RTX toxin-like protein
MIAKSSSSSSSRPSTTTARFESLETRAMLSATPDVHVGADPFQVGKTALFVTGTDGDDTITARHSGKSIAVKINDQLVGTFVADGTVVADGLAGNDLIDLSALNRRTVIDGDRGYDTLKAGKKSSILLGGSQNDRLVGSKQADLLIGGNGSDRIYGAGGSDVVILGSTIYDQDHAALWSLLSAWKTPASYAKRIEAITTGASASARLTVTGSYSLNATNVFSAPDPNDYAYGEKGRDLYYANPDTTGEKQDVIAKAKNETIVAVTSELA